MPNSIDSVKKIQGEIDVIIKQLKEVLDATITISKSSRTIDFSGLKTPENVDAALKKSRTNIEQLNAQIKEQERLERALISTIAKKVLAQESTAKAVAKEREELKILNRQQRNQVKQVSELSTAYEKVNAQLNLQIREYQNLSVLQKQGNKLTTEQAKRMDALSKSIEKNQKTLKDTDAEVGRFQRNVGNYAGSFNGLANSINQLTREAPAFANSFQTGFLAISNNLPILADEIQRLKVANLELAASGKPTQSILKQLAGAVFSWGTALSVGVTLLTIYGAKMVEWTKTMLEGSDATKKIAENTKELNKQSQEISSKTIPQFQALVNIATNLNETEERRASAISELNKKYPDFNANILNEKDNTDLVSKAVSDYIIKLGEKAKAQAAMSMLQEKYNKLIIEEQKLEQKQQNILEAVNATRKLNNKELFETSEQAIEYVKSINDAVSGSSLPQSMRGGTSPLQTMYEGINDQLETTSKVQEEINALMQVYIDNVDLTGSTGPKSITERNKVSAIGLKTTEEQIEAAKKLSQAYKDLFSKEFASESLKEAIENLDLLNPQSVQRFSDALRNLQSFEMPEIDPEALIRPINEAVRLIDSPLLQEAINDLAGTFDQFTSVSGERVLSLFDKIRIGGIESFEEIAEVAQDSFAIIGGIADTFYSGRIAQIEADIDANNEYYANLLENENLTENERVRLELDRQQKEKELTKKKQQEQRKQAIANKAFALADIALNTAIGISNAASKVVTIPLIPLIAGIGAAQAAIALATPIPQFAEGGVMEKDGLMMINDHSSGRLEVVERDGKLLMTDKKNAVVEGKAGDIIHKDAKQHFKKLANEDILKDIDTHTFNASIQHQNYLMNKAANLKTISDNRLQTDRIVKAINAKKYRFNVTNNVSLKDDLAYLKRGDF